MFLMNVPVVYDLVPPNVAKPLDQINVQGDINKKWSLGVECSQFNQTYFFISNEKDTRLEFVVRSRPKSDVTDFFKKLFGMNLGVSFLASS